MPVTAPIVIRQYRWILLDALSHAGSIAVRAQEATEGSATTLLFEDARKAIADFRENHPAMKALATASLKDMT